ncbi:hypothetical protein [Prauserella shujinwangii]|uniref:hypothetical protein n=1 Tax=Prauserella shujinwangii TaxID=1453103 RepID=UPI0015E61AD1|nr:hypothetical protein [Prauserella shujinwangii]
MTVSDSPKSAFSANDTREPIIHFGHRREAVPILLDTRLGAGHVTHRVGDDRAHPLGQPRLDPPQARHDLGGDLVRLHPAGSSPSHGSVGIPDDATVSTMAPPAADSVTETSSIAPCCPPEATGVAERSGTYRYSTNPRVDVDADAMTEGSWR